MPVLVDAMALFGNLMMMMMIMMIGYARLSGDVCVLSSLGHFCVLVRQREVLSC
jgi:hypothetical protein